MMKKLFIGLTHFDQTKANKFTLRFFSNTPGFVSPAGLIRLMKKRIAAAAASFRRWSDSEIVGCINLDSKCFMYMFMMVFLLSCNMIHCEEKKPESVHLVDFKFDKRDLKDILNEFAQLRGINILYSSTTHLNAKVTFDAGKKITFLKAWDFLLMMLEQAGFSLVNQGKDLYALTAVDNVHTNPVPTFINIDSNELPLTQERVRYIYYFKNINLATQQSDISAVLKNFFDSKGFPQQLIFDQNFNAMIITAKSEMVKAVMRFIDVFDQSVEGQSIDIFQLKFANSVEVASILTDQLISGQGGSKSNKGMSAKSPTSPDGSAMFASTTRVISLFGSSSALGSSSTTNSSNSIVIFGKKKDIELVKNFIQTHLDVPLEQGKSFFHVVELQWIQASTLTDVLNNLVKPSSGSGQSTSVSLSDLAFDPQIQVVAESITQGLGQSQGDSASLASGTSNTLSRGSNKVIIAATNKDWGRIQEVIKKIDIPQKQVILEVLILDLSLIFSHKIASQVRTNSLTAAIFPKTVQAQAAMLVNAVTTPMESPGGASLQSDLSNILGLISGGLTDQTEDSTILMIGDKTNTNGIWAFFQLLALHQTTKTISRAFVVAQNNQPAVITSTITKRLKGKLTAGVTATISYQTQSAPVTVNITPLISSNDIVNLQMDVAAEYWDDPANGDSGTAQIRQVQTNFSMHEGQVAVLGGLTKDQIDIIYNGVPFLEKIPLVNLFFTNRSKTEDKTKLFMIIKPTIIKPIKNGIGKVTRRMAAVTDHLLHDDDAELFSSLKDPISHWVFDDNASSVNNGLPLHDLFMEHHNQAAMGSLAR